MTQTKMKKLIKILAIALTGVGLIAMLIVGAMFLASSEKVTGENQSVVLADSSGTCGDNLTWTLDSNGVLTISGTGEMYNYDSAGTTPWARKSVDSTRVTQIIVQYGVTSIGDYAFSQTYLTSINVPSSVTSIGNFAFSSCIDLTSVSFGTGVTSIGNCAFEGCSSLTSIEIPNGVTSIGNRAFYNCRSLTSIEIPSSVTSIGYGAFDGCSSLTSIEIPDSVTSIGVYAFYGCSSLKTAVLSDNITELGTYAFYDCAQLSFFTIPSNVLTIGDRAFQRCRSLKSITFNDKLETIGNNAFANCTNLRSISLPESLISIGDYAFDSCVRITSLNIPKNVESMGANIVSNCTNLIFLNIDSENTFYNDGDGNNIIIRNSDRALIATSRESEITSATTIIGAGAFKNRLDLVDVFIPVGVTTIDREAFYGCTNLTSISIPRSVTTIGDGAFRYCSSLTSMEIPNSVTSIGGSAFYGCSSLTSIEIPNSVTSIGPMTFLGCKGLISVTLSDNITVIPSNGGALVNSGVFTDCNNLRTVVWSPNIESIGDYAFSGCNRLESIVIPNSVTRIGKRAFSECYNLTSMMIPDSVYSMGIYVFESCRSLESINIPTNVTAIREGSFYGCSSLTSINIPSSVTSIWYNAFYGCNNLMLITVDNENTTYNDGNGSNKIIETATGNIIAQVFSVEETSGTCGDNLTWTLNSSGVLTISGSGAMTDYAGLGYPWNASDVKEVVIESGVTSIGSSAFYGCSSLTSINIPDGVTSIGYNAFEGCSSLVSINIPSSVTNIGERAFYNCQSLISIDIPNNVTSIGNRAFSWCTNLTSINIPSSVISMGIYTFEKCSKLTSVTFENGVTSIGGSAFSECYNLTSIEIPSSVTSIGNYAFSSCRNLTSITVDSENTVYNDANGSNCLIETSTSKLIKGCNSSVISDSITSVEYRAFYGCSVLKSIRLNNVTSIESQAFDGCNNLTIIIGSTTIPTLGIDAFGSDGYGFISRILVPQSALNEYKTAENWSTYASIIEGYGVGDEVSITWQNWDGELLEEDQVAFAELPVYNSAAPTRAATVKYSYDWDGWTTPIELATEDAVYIASFTKNGQAYTIIYNSNDGTNRTLTQNVTYHGNFTTYDYDAFTRNSANLVGWSTDPTTQTGIYYDVNTYYGFEDTENITLYAVWELEEYTITYTLDGGSATNPESYTIEDEFTLNNPIKAGYEFTGWTGSNGSIPETTVTVTAGTTGDLTYTVNWSEAIIYTITTTVDGVDSTQNYTIESNDITLANPSKNGYDFAGWTGSNGDNPELVVTIPAGSYGDKEYTANFEAIEYIITYTLNGGKTTNPATYTIESDAITLVNPTKRGYTFLGWTGANGEEPSLEVVIPTGSTENKAYIANWSEPIIYTITYVLNGGTAENPTTYTVESSKITLAQPTRAGATFKGWTGSNGSTAQKTVSINAGSIGDKTYTANWKLTSYSITYELNGGILETENPVKFNAETETFTLNNPIKENYDFIGWTGGDLEEPTLEVTIPQGSIEARTYTANWTPTEYAITYTLNGGEATNPTTYTVESNTITLVNPTKAGYNFVGWTGSNKDDPEVEVVIPQGSTGNKAYTANFDVVTYTITTTVDGMGNIQNYNIESEDITLNNPSKTGYTFIGWTGSNGNEPQLEVVIPQRTTGNKEYTANFEVITYTITTIVDGVETTQNYTVESDDITLVNPSKKGYRFTGWIGSNGDEPEVEVMISKGSMGDKEYTATWEEVDETNLSLIIGLSVPAGAILIVGAMLLVLIKKKKIKLW